MKDNVRSKGIRGSSCLVKLWAGLAIPALVILAVPNRALAVCGPANHWVASCPSGTDILALSATITTDLGGSPIVGSGPVTILRGSPIASDPANPSNLNKIPAEVVSLTLTGSGLTIVAGDGVANLKSDGPTYSPASITESSSNPAQATVALDIFVQLKSSLGINVHNQVPIHVEATVDRFPLPFNATVTGPIPLLSDTGVKVLTITNISFAATLSTNPILPANAVVNGASFQPATQPNAAVAAGSIVSIFGTNLASQVQVASSLPLATTLLDTSVTFNGIPAPLFVVSDGQINAQVPFEVPVGTISVQVKRGSNTSSTQSLTVAPVSPGIFTTNQQGTGQGAVLIANTAIIAAPSGSISGQQTQPVNRGDFISIFCTGLGDVTNRPLTGAPATGGSSVTLASATVTIGGITVPAIFSGLTTFVGLYQVNVQVPDGTPPGNAVDLVVNIAGATSNHVTIAVQ